MGKKKKICPSCGGTLKEVFAKATYGRVLLLDQCGRCGGVWFDKWELYFLNPDEARRLDGLDLSALTALNPLSHGSGKCPLCAEALKDFTDPSFDADTSIKRCPQCSGLWLNRGELTRFTARRAKLRGADKKAAPHGPNLTTLKNLQKAIDTSSIGRPYALPAVDDSPITASEMAKDLAPVILRILFKLIFKI